MHAEYSDPVVNCQEILNITSPHNSEPIKITDHMLTPITEAFEFGGWCSLLVLYLVSYIVTMVTQLYGVHQSHPPSDVTS